MPTTPSQPATPTEPPPRGVCMVCGMDWRPLLEAKDLSASLPGQLSRWKARTDLVLGLYVGVLIAACLAGERLGIPQVYTEWKAWIAVLLFAGPLVALIVACAVGSTRIERSVSREAGVCCVSCGRAPRSNDMANWIALNRCGECGGPLAKDFSAIQYKDTWPQWQDHECGAAEGQRRNPHVRR